MPTGIIRRQARVELMEEQAQRSQEFLVAYLSVFVSGDGTEERVQGGGLHAARIYKAGKSPQGSVLIHGDDDLPQVEDDGVDAVCLHDARFLMPLG